MAQGKFYVLRGEVNWAKIVGKAKPHTGLPKYDKGPSWSVDLTPDAKSLKVMEDAGFADKLKDPRKSKSEKETRKEPFISLRILENRTDGKKNDAPSIKDASGREWGDDEIGNGSVMDIQVKVVDYGDTMGVYYQKGRVLKHVPYEGGSDDFEPLSEDDEFFAGGGEKTSPNPDDLDDDVPF